MKISKTLKNRIIFLFIFFVVIPFSIVNLISNSSLEKNIEEKIVSSKIEFLRLKALSIEEILKEMMSAATVCSLDNDIIRILKNPESFELYDKLKYYENLYSVISNSMLRKYECAITIMDNYGHIYSDWTGKEEDYDRLKNEEWYKEVINSNGEFLWINHDESLVNRHEYENINLSVAKLIEDTTSRDNVGIVIISISKNEFDSILKNKSTDSSFSLIVDSQNNIIVDEYGGFSYENSQFDTLINEPSGSIRFNYENTEKTANYHNVKYSNWYVVEVIDNRVMLGETISIRKINYIVSVAFLLLFMVLTFILSNNLSKRIRGIRDQILLIKDDNLDIVLDEDGSEEISDLAKAFNRMILRIKKLITKVESDERTKQELKFKALQAQINPHFIFNSLNNIKLLAYMNDANQVGDMISALGSLMEESIGRGGDFITLGKEISYIQNYMYLQNIKYNNNISLKITIPNELNKIEIIKFVLQPIIENCIYHGIDSSNEKIKIKISAKEINDSVIIMIEDNGIGIEPQKLNKLNNDLSEAGVSSSDRVGLINVNGRIKLNYGNDYGLTIDSDLTNGTVVRILIPKVVQEVEG